MPGRSVRKSMKKRKSRRKNTRCCKWCKRMCKKRCQCKTKCKKRCRCKCRTCPKNHKKKNNTKRKIKRRVSLKITERINMKKIQQGGSFKGIMRSMGLGDVNLAGSGMMNSIKGGYQTYIGGDDVDTAAPSQQQLIGGVRSSVVPNVVDIMKSGSNDLINVESEIAANS